MPALIPAVVGYAVASSVVGATVFGVVISGLASQVIGAVVSFGVSSLLSSANTPDAPDLSASLTQTGAGRTTQVRQPISPHQIHYGQVKASGPILFLHSQEDNQGREFGDLYIVHGLSGTKVKAIRTVYFGEELASEFEGDVNGAGRIRVGKHLGETDQEADANFLTEIGAPHWGVNHRLRGRAYIATKLTFHAFDLPQLENISVILDGVDTIYDPRTGLTGFHNNAALCVANWITSPWGEARAWSKLHEPSLIEAANICDERVLVLFRTTTATISNSALTLTAGSRFLDWGDGVRFTSSGSLPAGLHADITYYAIPSADETIRLASSVANAFAETGITLGEAGAGTLTLRYYDEARYKCNGTFTLDMEKGEVLDQLRACMAGYAFPRGGKWYVHAGAAALPTITLTDNDLRAHPVVTPKRSMRDRFNGVRGVFVNPSANWQPTDAPPRIVQAYIAEDAGEELVADLRSNFIISETQMQRAMKIALEQNRRQGEAEVPCKLSAFKLAPLDGVWLTLDGFFEQSQHRVTGWTLSEDLGINIRAQQDDSAIYDWSASEELIGTEFQHLILPDGSVLTAPASVTVLTIGVTTFTKIPIEWDEVKSIFLDGYDVEYKSQGAVDWTSFGFVSGTAARKAVVDKTVPTDFRVRAVATNLVESPWTENLAPGVPTSVTSPATGEITWTNGTGAAEIQFFKDGTFFERVSATPASYPGLGNGSYQLRTLNSGGNMSDLSSAVVLSGAGAGPPGEGNDDGDGGDGDGGDGDGDA